MVALHPWALLGPSLGTTWFRVPAGRQSSAREAAEGRHRRGERIGSSCSQCLLGWLATPRPQSLGLPGRQSDRESDGSRSSTPLKSSGDGCSAAWRDGHDLSPHGDSAPNHAPVAAGGDETSALPLHLLSSAERRVFDLALDGRSTTAIAEALVLSEATVRTHLTHIYDKLQVKGRIELLARLRSFEVTSEPSDPPLTVRDTARGVAPMWIWIVLAAFGGAAGLTAPPSAILSGPILLTAGLMLSRRLRERWVPMVLIVVGSVLCLVALWIALSVLGLIAIGT